MAEISESALAAAFAAALSQHEKERQSEEGRVTETRKASITNALNPNGGVKPKLKRETIFCGAVQKEDELKAVEIELFNKVAPGRYKGGKWSVRVEDDGMGTSRVDVRVPVNDLNALMDLPNSLVGILSEIVAEAESRAKATK